MSDLDQKVSARPVQIASFECVLVGPALDVCLSLFTDLSDANAVWTCKLTYVLAGDL